MQLAPQRAGTDFLRLLRKAIRPHAGRQVHVVLDNLNQIEIWFGIITRQSIRRGTFPSVAALIARIRAYVKTWNVQAKPFVWTASAGEILAKVRLVQTNIKQR